MFLPRGQSVEAHKSALLQWPVGAKNDTKVRPTMFVWSDYIRSGKVIAGILGASARTLLRASCSCPLTMGMSTGVIACCLLYSQAVRPSVQQQKNGISHFWVLMDLNSTPLEAVGKLKQVLSW